jgi:5-methylcytosine-specific restriction endonuclease McrA
MAATSLPMLSAIPGDQLTARLYELRRRERHLQVEFLHYLAELDRRRLYLDLGFSSLFAYCTDHLGLSRSAAFRRTTAARLLARFPVVADYLADGRLSLTTLVELRDVLSEERLDQILGRAAGRSEEEVKALVAALAPGPVPKTTLRALPAVASPVATAASTLDMPLAPPGPPATVPLPASPPPPPPAPPPRLTPVAEGRHVLRLAVDDDFVADLQAVRASLSHVIPDGRLDLILAHCLRTTREVCDRRRRGSGRAPATAPTQGRYVPAATRDLVWRRDGGRCTFTGAGGRRCESTYQLQVHHIVPFARGGTTSPENLALLCASHNRHQARMDFGDARIDRAIAGHQPAPGDACKSAGSWPRPAGS